MSRFISYKSTRWFLLKPLNRQQLLINMSVDLPVLKLSLMSDETGVQYSNVLSGDARGTGFNGAGQVDPLMYVQRIARD